MGVREVDGSDGGGEEIRVEDDGERGTESDHHTGMTFGRMDREAEMSTGTKHQS
jgi:hypothetical protein